MRALLALLLLLSACAPSTPEPASESASGADPLSPYAEVMLGVHGDAVRHHLFVRAGQDTAWTAARRGPPPDVEVSLRVDTTGEGTPRLFFDLRVRVVDTLLTPGGGLPSYTARATLFAYVPDALVSVERQQLRPDTFALAQSPSATAAYAEIQAERYEDAFSEGLTLRTLNQPSPTGYLAVDSIRAGMAFGTFLIENDPYSGPAAERPPISVRATGAFRAPLRWPDRPADSGATSDLP